MWPFKPKKVATNIALTERQYELLNIIDTAVVERSKPPFEGNISIQKIVLPITDAIGRMKKASILIEGQLLPKYACMPRSVALAVAADNYVFLIASRVEERKHTDLELLMFVDLLNRTNEASDAFIV